MSLKDKLPRSIEPTKSDVLWKGPEADGVTFSLLSRFLVCRERFRLLVVEGLKPADEFNHRIQYGQMWHTCEEHAHESNNSWAEHLRVYCRSLCVRYPLQQEQISHWYNVCKVQFAIYQEYWSYHREQVKVTPLLQEHVFDVPYKLPSGRKVRLRGKWDSVDLVGEGKSAGIWLQENKTKSDISESQIKRQLSFDLQTMLYIVAFREYQDDGVLQKFWFQEPPVLVPAKYVEGVRYNVVRRPLSGGTGTIRQHKPSKSNPFGESPEEFYQRLSKVIRDDVDSYFMRWQVYITPQDVLKFRRQCLDPILEQLCDWWSCQNGGQVSPYSSAHQHWRHPYGVFNILNEGGSSDYDEYLASGSMSGLQKVESLFTELE